MVNTQIENRIRTVLREHYGEFSTNLELYYENKLTDALLLESNTKKHEWATYNQVILELKNNLKAYQLVKELQYRLTDHECPKNACIDVIGHSKKMTPELQRLYEKITNFSD